MHSIAQFGDMAQSLSFPVEWARAIIIVIAAFPVSLICMELGLTLALWPLRKFCSDNWVERARLAYPGWIVLVVGPMMLIAAFIVAAVEGSRVPTPVAELIPLLCGVSAFLGTGLACARAETRIKQRTILASDWLRGWGVMMAFFLPIYVLFGFMAAMLVPHSMGLMAAVIIAGTVLVGILLSFGGSLALARFFGIVKPASPRLRGIVERTASQIGARAPSSYILRWKSANALALPLTQTVLFSDTALAEFNDDELAIICFHELSHLQEPKRILIARLAGQFVFLPLFAAGPIIRSYGVAGFVAALFTAIVGSFLVHRIRRAMEIRADEAARKQETGDGAYAKVLEKLYRMNMIPVVMRSKRTVHPHLYDRLIAAQVTPDYPRPAPPSMVFAWLALFIMGGLAITLIGTLTSLPELLVP
jgi:Zn-dependent protease with chaperone function